MAIAQLCEIYGWTWQEYMDQPTFFIRALMIKHVLEAKAARLAQSDYAHK